MDDLLKYLIISAGLLVWGGTTLAFGFLEEGRIVQGSDEAVQRDSLAANRKRLGARCVILAPVWPLAALWLTWEALKASHRAADWLLKTADLPLLRPKVLPPPSREDRLTELERKIDGVIEEVELL